VGLGDKAGGMPRSNCLLITLLCIIAFGAVAHGATDRMNREILDAPPPPLHTVVPWLAAILLLLLTGLVLFKKSKRAGYQDR
jgi:hypothetical protein